MSNDNSSSNTSRIPGKDDFLRAAKMVLKEIQNKQKEGSVPAFLGTEGMLALMWDKIQRYQRDGGNMDELLGLVVDSLAVFTNEMVKQGIFDRMDEMLEEVSDTMHFEAPEENEDEPDDIFCPRCNTGGVTPGEATRELPTPVCDVCEEYLPEKKMTAEEYDAWVEAGIVEVTDAAIQYVPTEEEEDAT